VAINKRKILESAQKNLQKGALDKALEDYRTLLKADPHDSNVLLKVGDLHLKLGKRGEAINAYVRVAQQFTRDGFDAKAVALYKQISRLDPKRHDVCVPLADLYARMGLVTDAIASLQAAADAAYRVGDKDGALELLRRMAGLDPTNTTNRLKVAELLAQEGRKGEALSEYEAVADELQRRGEEEERIKVLERVIAVEPDRVAALRDVTRAKLVQEQYAVARKLAEKLLAAQPDDLEGREMLGHALAGAGDEEHSREVFRELADLYRQRGDEDRARDLMQRFAGVEALVVDDSDARLDTPPPAVLELDTPAEVDDFLLEPSPPPQAKPPAKPAAPAKAAAPAAKPAPAPPPRAAAPPPEPAVAQLKRAAVPSIDPESTAPDQLLAEANVYLRYGKHERAVGALRAVLAKEPGHRAALEQLGDALAGMGEAAHAVTAYQRAVEAARNAGDVAGVTRMRQRLAALDAAAASLLAPAEATPAEATPAAEREIIDEDIEIDLDGSLEVPEEDPTLEADASIPIDISDELGIEADAAPPLEPAALEEAKPAPELKLTKKAGETSSTTTPAQVAEELEEAEFYLEQGLLDEARRLYEKILAVAPNHPQAMLRLGEIGARAGAPAAAPPAPKSGAAPAPAPKPAPAAKPPAPAAIEIDLDEEIDFGGELEDPEPDTGIAPASPPPRAEMPPAPAPRPAPPPGAARAPAPPPVAPPAPPLAPRMPARPQADVTTPSLPAPMLSGGEFDLAAELSGALGADDGPVRTLAGTEEEAFEQVFSAFKSGVERELGDADHEARYDLGIAYKEMGLLDDAIGEFRIAMRAPERKLSCLHMMGLCALDLGRAADALGHLEQALSLPDLPSDQRVPLRYDLGRAYAAQGDVARARSAFEAVRAADPKFGDVARELAALASRAPAKGAPTAPETYESFDDLMAGDTGEPVAKPVRYESFDELFADGTQEPVDAPAEKPVKSGKAEPAPPAPEPEPEVERAREPPAPEPAPSAAGERSGPKKRKKISFV
jgi:tetratricopeptide (TPR) repeat protein